MKASKGTAAVDLARWVVETHDELAGEADDLRERLARAEPNSGTAHIWEAELRAAERELARFLEGAGKNTATLRANWDGPTHETIRNAVVRLAEYLECENPEEDFAMGVEAHLSKLSPNGPHLPRILASKAVAMARKEGAAGKSPRGGSRIAAHVGVALVLGLGTDRIKQIVGPKRHYARG